MRSGLSLDELCSDANATPGLSHTSFEYVSYAEFASNLLYVHRAALVDEAGIACDHEHPFDARETGDDFLNDTVAEVLLLRIAAHVVERERRYRCLVRK